MFHLSSKDQKRMMSLPLKNKLLCSNKIKSVKADQQNPFMLRFIRLSISISLIDDEIGP